MAHRRDNNTGTIYAKPNGRFQAQISAGGKRIGRTFKSRLECKDWIWEMESKKRAGFSFSANVTTVEAYLLQWLRTIKSSVKPKTYEQYGHIVRKYICPSLGKQKLLAVKPFDIQSLYTTLSGDLIGTRTVQLTHSVLHNAYAKAIKWGLTNVNPVAMVDRPKTQAKEMKVLSQAEAHRFILECSSHQLCALFRLAITTGLRLGELKGLQWKDVDWAASQVHVRRQVQRERGKGQVITSLKTKGSNRVVGIGSTTLRELMRHRERATAINGMEPPENRFIFTGVGTKPLGSSGIQKSLKKILTNAAISPIHFHELRHTAASLMLSTGTPIFQVSRQLGHTRASTTLDVYGHMIPGLEHKTSSLIDEMLTPIATELQLDSTYEASSIVAKDQVIADTQEFTPKSV